MDTIVTSVRAMRPWLRFIAGLLGLIGLYGIYNGVVTVVGHSVLPASAGLFIIAIAAFSLVPVLLMWRQSESSTRFINEPTQARLQEVTSAIRRFWRLSAVAVVLQLTVFIAGFALHGGVL